MFDKFFNFISSLTDGANAQQGKFQPDDTRLAAAALMFHVIEADGVLRDVETQRLRSLVSAENEVDGKALKELLEAAQKADHQAVDLYSFTSVLNNNLDKEQRLHFIELLWQLVYSDGHRHELEDNVVWRISELLHIESHDRVALRQRVEMQLNADKTE